MPFIAHYLISSFGFSRDRALKISANKHHGSIKADRVHSVITFLSEIGLDDSQIRNLVSLDPYILGSNVEKTLRPRVRQLMDGGFAGETLVQLFLSNPQCLTRDTTLSRLRFWRNFVGDNDEVFLKVLRRNRFLISVDIDEHVVPRMNLLKEFGLSNEDILNLLMKGQACFVRTVESLRQILERTEQLGFSRGSSMFICGLRIVSIYSKETLHKKEELFKRAYGWSDEEVSSAVKKYPYILSLSEENIKSKMNFLVKDAGFEPRTITSMPSLLSYSLSRLMSRHNVLRTLEAKKLKKNCNLLNACVLSEKRFLGFYVLPFEKDLPGLSETYANAYLEKMPV
jgi:mTERF domain-containing protein, mitochondrial